MMIYTIYTMIELPA